MSVNKQLHITRPENESLNSFYNAQSHLVQSGKERSPLVHWEIMNKKIQ